MATFVIIPIQGENKELINKLKSDEFGNNAMILPKGEWLVSYDGTTKQLSDHLGISEDVHNSAIVLNVSTYWGRAFESIWEWFEVHQDD